MLKNVPKIIPPELLKILCEMGHGDEIVIADGNFPSTTLGQRVVRMDGHGVPEILEAVLELIPLDTYKPPVCIMKKVAGDEFEVPIWKVYKDIAAKHTDEELEQMERFAFYDRAKTAYCVIATGEASLYANIILKKGVVV